MSGKVVSWGRALVLLACLIFQLQAGNAQPQSGEGVIALVGGRLIDGYGGPPLGNSVVLIRGNKIEAVGRQGEVAIPAGARVISTEGMTVMPGLADMHVHLMIIGHADYDHWDTAYRSKFRDVIMPIAAKELLMAGVTMVRDVGAPLEDILAVRDRINRGEIPGPRVFASGPFLQKVAPKLEAEWRWEVHGADDARAKTKKILDAGADMIKVIDQDQMTLDELKAIVETAHSAGKHVTAHAHRAEEIRQGIRAGVDSFEHTGLATQPGYPDDILAMLRERNATLYWCPTIEGLYLYSYTVDQFPERLDDPRLKADVPPDIYEDIRKSIAHPEQIPYFQLTRRREPTLAKKFNQLRSTGVTMITGTDSGIPLNFHFDSTWRELDTWVRLGMNPMDVIRGATYWPAQLMKRNDLGVVAAGKLADIIVVDGDPLRSMESLRHLTHIIKDGKVVK
ncbi:MAG: amidohydrolase family protein [Acidobacteria bacterium]|nr:amidohydrolase family protein [Acidobacteriota bacterium]